MSLTGMILDVSQSMRRSIKSDTNEPDEPWVQTVFNVIDDLLELDVSTDNRVFAIGVGANCIQNYTGKELFDVIGTLKKIKEIMETPATENHINDILNILEKNGAHNVRKWARDIALIQLTVSDYTATLILWNLQTDKDFLWTFVHEYLPSAVRDTETTEEPHTTSRVRRVFAFRRDKFYSSLASRIKPATKEGIEKIVEKAKNYITSNGRWIRLKFYGAENSFRVLKEEGTRTIFCQKDAAQILKDVGLQSIFTVQDAARIIRGDVSNKKLSTERRRELLENVEPFIYGLTPLYQAIKKAISLFERDTSTNKFLFVVSDGKPTDGSNEDRNKINEISSKLRKAGVKIVSCFISEAKDIQPKRLYEEMQPGWKPGAQFLFSLSSKISTQLIPLAILVKRGWKVDITKNETKLFLHVNHPDHLRYVK